MPPTSHVSALATAILVAVHCAPVRGDGYALVIGVNHCPDFELPGGGRPSPLRGAETDADEVAKLLLDDFGFRAENVTVLKGEEATRANLQTSFKKLAERTRTADQFVFYFAGHGTQVADRRPFDESDDRLDEALCPFDATADGKHLLVDDELAQWLENVAASQVTVILDCCHSGSGTKEPGDDLAARFLPGPVERKVASERDEPWRDLRSVTKSIGRQTVSFFACRTNQRAYERRLPGQKAPARAGQFTHFLLEGLHDRLADANRDGVVSNQEALDYAGERLSATFNELRQIAADRQEPTMEADVASSPILGRKP